MNVSIINREKIKKSIVKNSKNLIDLGREEVLLGFNGSGAVVSQNGIQSAIFSQSGDRIFDKIIKPAIVLDCIDAEISIPGSGDLSLDISSRLIYNLYGKIEAGIDFKEYENISKDFLSFCIEEIRKIGSQPMKKDLYKLINQEIKDPFIRSLIKNCLDLSGMRREIVCNISNSFETSVKIEQGYKFPIKPYQGFISGKWKKNNVAIVTIDGAIIEISEIHHLLEKCNEKEIPGIIFCRNFSPDVLNTLYVNKKRGTLDIIPFEISIEDETLNTLKDICVVAGSNLISSDMGDLISSSVRKGLIYVDSVEITDNFVKIFNKSTEKDAKIHLDFLKKKRADADPQIHSYIDNRIRSMICESISVSVGQNQLKKNKVTIEKIDSFLRSLKGFIRTGCIDVGEFEKSLLKRKKVSGNIEKIQIESIINTLKQSNKKIISAGSIVQALKTSVSTSNSIFSTSVILASDS
tara:strand:+ start:9615 stop:11009 length:1395 start_codon:yes stop_codon:yes gene_type:complete